MMQSENSHLPFVNLGLMKAFTPSTAPQQIIEAFSRRHALRIVPISEHVAVAQRRAFLSKADSLNASVRSAGFEYIPVDAHIPVLDIPVAAQPNPSRVLSTVVIQGNFAHERRDYRNIFADLKESLAFDLRAWGYLPLAGENATYVVDATLADPPFRLFLIGSGKPIEVPHELENIVSTHSRLNYDEFYALMSSMDICLPAFPANNAYYDVKASSTMAMAVECNVPTLVTERIRKSYTYLDDDRAVVTRPAAMREVEALRALRTGDAEHFLQKTGTSWDTPTGQAVEAMIRRGSSFKSMYCS
ncbi:putative eukaryotic translation initiation factor 5 [Mycena venus]|uniref:Putative eukaryotic translation initiation factor 5 n=1 Tax=Mycena venus TaxID=2733690 RepID=A0A8H6XRY9_9AGAR|nr:putative eukaryotic translation initiation factor 5 [Mycena venus]